jgi:hypothetical protein
LLKSILSVGSVGGESPWLRVVALAEYTCGRGTIHGVEPWRGVAWVPPRFGSSAHAKITNADGYELHVRTSEPEGRSTMGGLVPVDPDNGSRPGSLAQETGRRPGRRVGGMYR